MLEFPYEIKANDGPINEKKKKLFLPGSCELDNVIIQEIGLRMPAGYKNHAQKIYNINPDPRDVWLITYPKCGTTWTQVVILISIDIFQHTHIICLFVSRYVRAHTRQ